MRSLIEREGRIPEAAFRRIELSDLAVEPSADGSARIAWYLRGLTADSEGEYRYRMILEVLDSAGNPVTIRTTAPGVEEGPEPSLVLSGTTRDLPVTTILEVFLPDAGSGIYTARIRVTDIETGMREERTRGFEVPE
jgi:hypothetical protein